MFSSAHFALQPDAYDFILFDPAYPPELLQQLEGHDACIWALGRTSNGMSEADYSVITYDYALAAAKAFSTLPESNDKKLVFAYLSGAGTDQREGKAWQMFGRVKGALAPLSFQSLPVASLLTLPPSPRPRREGPRPLTHVRLPLSRRLQLPPRGDRPHPPRSRSARTLPVTYPSRANQRPRSPQCQVDRPNRRACQRDDRGLHEGRERRGSRVGGQGQGWERRRVR